MKARHCRPEVSLLRRRVYGRDVSRHLQRTIKSRAVKKLFENNRRWAAAITKDNPQFFETLSRQQNPDYLWIGCSDSRVPPNQIVDLPPGELFVHRNVANLVVPDDPSCLSVIQYAVDALKVKHIIVCGHYGCGGVQAAISERPKGPIDNWLMPIKKLYDRKASVFEEGAGSQARVDQLCEVNVIEQVRNVCHTGTVQDAWERGQALQVHGWIYRLSDGLLTDLEVTADGPASVPDP